MYKYREHTYLFIGCRIPSSSPTSEGEYSRTFCHRIRLTPHSDLLIPPFGVLFEPSTSAYSTHISSMTNSDTPPNSSQSNSNSDDDLFGSSSSSGTSRPLRRITDFGSSGSSSGNSSPSTSTTPASSSSPTVDNRETRASPLSRQVAEIMKKPLVGQVYRPGQPIVSSNHRALNRYTRSSCLSRRPLIRNRPHRYRLWEKANAKYLEGLDWRARWDRYISRTQFGQAGSRGSGASSSASSYRGEVGPSL